MFRSSLNMVTLPCVLIAPSIYENMDIKKGILLQLFSGARKDFENSGRGKFRYCFRILFQVFTFKGFITYKEFVLF